MLDTKANYIYNLNNSYALTVTLTLSSSFQSIIATCKRKVWLVKKF